MLERSNRLVDQAYDAIEEQIVTLQLPPRHAFSEGDLADSLSIGRTPVREALLRLVSEHLVISIPRKGMVIADINVADFMNLLQTRQILDALLAKQAVARASTEQKNELEKLAKNMTKAAENNDISEFMRFDRQFDYVMFESARNIFAAQAALPLHAHSRRFWYYHKTNDDLKEPAKLHTEIMKGIAENDEARAIAASDKLVGYMIDLAKSAMGFE
jgi:DNA-binding GntR family transcriptional regulator